MYLDSCAVEERRSNNRQFYVQVFDDACFEREGGVYLVDDKHVIAEY